MDNFNNRITAGLSLLGIEVAPEAVQQLSIYFKELKKWSQKVNLIAKSSTDEQILEKHFLDSLTLVPLLGGDQRHLLDIGTGAGFPGLICKAVCPQLQLTLVEPRLKRVSFLKHMVRSLNLQNVHILASRVEDVETSVSASEITHITARALNEISPFLEMVQQFAVEGAGVICMKGPRWEEELSAADPVIQRLGYRLVSNKQYSLPFSGGERNILIFKLKN